ncbi:hypothetical protein [Streptomyces sp. DSM 40750]|uniref:hypothetical protein n=1 Tax=Streptomyces sp. DSM 40750 TaxID=2801030 RepID=UPI00214D0607|nr:hypothetical protein [Streptomyces sp. DSM 40750]UUU22229.1 hypothetical protein JIX55_19000 [Streptomyces sp. DSM 40750]
MMDSNGTGSADELCTRVETAVAGTPYLVRRTERGFDVTVDVTVPQWQELLIRSRISQVHTYRVVLRPEQKVFTMTDVVRTVEVAAGLGGVRLGKTVSVGRSVSFTSRRSPDGSSQYTFSSAEGHRMIRGAAGELGWSEARPASVKIAAAIGILGGVGALAALITLAVINWL